MPTGFIVKALSGYYYVLEDDASPSRREPVQCRARGLFKLTKQTPLVGDRVVFERTENGEGTVTELLPRTSELIRPPIANMEIALLVFSVAEPDLNLQLLDKFLVHVEYAGLVPIICLTKTDLLRESGDSEAAARLDDTVRLYRGLGYEVLETSSLRGEGVQEVADRLIGSRAVVAGQSGVGKSSLLNALIPGMKLETNEISQKLGRGKHTTRHVELMPLPGDRVGYVADTPGFSQLDFAGLEAEELGGCFREFARLAPECRFRGCLHLQEPDCAVRAALEAGELAESRYEHYQQFVKDIRDRKRRY